MARAHGSYPWCREFKSPFRYSRSFGLSRLLLFCRRVLPARAFYPSEICQGGHEHHGKGTNFSEKRGIFRIFSKRHMCHQQRCGRKHSAGNLRLCIWHDRDTAVPYEHRQSAGRLCLRHAARKNRHQENSGAPDSRLWGRIYDHGFFRMDAGSHAGIFHGRRC